MTMMISLTLFLISTVCLVIKRNNAAGVRCGIAGILFALVFFVFWFGVQAKGRPAWHMFLLAFSHPMVVLISLAGLSITIANAVVCYRQREDDYYAG